MTDYGAGDVLHVSWYQQPIRVIVADSVEVLYDALIPDAGWNLARARTAVYYRAPTSFVQLTGRRIRTELLTEQELARHRPDLPMRMLRNAEAEWGGPLADLPKIGTAFEVEISRLALIPFGSKGAPQKAVFFEAQNSRSFSGDEHLELAQSVQIADCPDISGVGLYRSGISSGVPSYYVWGAVDKAGHAG